MKAHAFGKKSQCSTSHTIQFSRWNTKLVWGGLELETISKIIAKTHKQIWDILSLLYFLKLKAVGPDSRICALRLSKENTAKLRIPGSRLWSVFDDLMSALAGLTAVNTISKVMAIRWIEYLVMKTSAHWYSVFFYQKTPQMPRSHDSIQMLHSNMLRKLNDNRS